MLITTHDRNHFPLKKKNNLLKNPNPGIQFPWEKNGREGGSSKVSSLKSVQKYRETRMEGGEHVKEK